MREVPPLAKGRHWRGARPRRKPATQTLWPGRPRRRSELKGASKRRVSAAPDTPSPTPLHSGVSLRSV